MDHLNNARTRVRTLPSRPRLPGTWRRYLTMGRALFSDLGTHGLAEGQPLKHAYFPIIYPQSDPVERAQRAAGKCTRTTEGILRLGKNMGGARH